MISWAQVFKCVDDAATLCLSWGSASARENRARSRMATFAIPRSDIMMTWREAYETSRMISEWPDLYAMFPFIARFPFLSIPYIKFHHGWGIEPD